MGVLDSQEAGMLLRQTLVLEHTLRHSVERLLYLLIGENAVHITEDRVAILLAEMLHQEVESCRDKCFDDRFFALAGGLCFVLRHQFVGHGFVLLLERGLMAGCQQAQRC